MILETLIFETAAGVANVTLNRPDRLNAFNRKMCEEFRLVWSTIRENTDIRAVVLRAEGDRAFCTGVDVKEGGWSRPDESPFDQDDPGRFLGPKQNRVWKPVICALHGMVAGGAFYFVNEADIVICSDDAQFFDPHVTFGMVSAVEPVGMLGRVPLGEITRMALLGNDERISAATALRIGLVSEVTTRAGLFARAAELAAIIAAKPGAAVQGSVRAIWESRGLVPSVAAENALKYTQLGNPLGQAEVAANPPAKAKWSLR